MFIIAKDYNESFGALTEWDDDIGAALRSWRRARNRLCHRRRRVYGAILCEFTVNNLFIFVKKREMLRHQKIWPICAHWILVWLQTQDDEKWIRFASVMYGCEAWARVYVCAAAYELWWERVRVQFYVFLFSFIGSFTIWTLAAEDPTFFPIFFGFLFSARLSSSLWLYKI